MQFHSGSKIAAGLILFTILFSLTGQAAGAERDEQLSQVKSSESGYRLARKPGVRFVEVEITLSEQFDLAYISGLPRAPGNGPEVLGDSGRVKVQLPGSEFIALVEAGAEVDIVRSFMLVEGFASETASLSGEVTILADCSSFSEYEYDYSDLRVDIEDSDYWWGSIIDFSGVGGGKTVSCIDIHYVVRINSWNFFDVAFSEEGYMSYIYPLVTLWWGFDGIDSIQWGVVKSGVDTLGGGECNRRQQLYRILVD